MMNKAVTMFVLFMLLGSMIVAAQEEVVSWENMAAKNCWGDIT